MNNLYENLYSQGIISDASFERLNKKTDKPLLSVYWEIKSLLYLGVLMLIGGLGLLIYENADSIGYQFVLALIAIIWIGCFAWCTKNKLPFNTMKVRAPNNAFDYVLLLGTISFVTFIGYLQYQYNVFGSHYGMAAFIPMVVLFFVAYYFDHLGILSMAIANLAIWMGVCVTPTQLLLHNEYNKETIIYAYLLLGVLLLLGAMLTQRFNFKKHFKFSYAHYGVQVTFIILFAGYYHYFDSRGAIPFMLGIFTFAFFVYKDARQKKSFYFSLLAILYSYVAVSCLFGRLLSTVDDEVVYRFFLFYLVSSGIGVIFFLIRLNKKIKSS